GSLTPPAATEGLAFSNVVVFHFTDSNSTANINDFTATVNRGDTTMVTLTSAPSAAGQIVAHTGGGFDVQLSYTYAEEMSGKTFSVQVTGPGGVPTISASTNTFRVADAALTSTGADLTPPSAT